MKYSLAVLLAIIFFTACNDKKTKEEQKLTEEITSTFDSTTLPTSEAEIDEDQSFSMHYKFVPGESFKYRMTVISENEQSMETDTTISAHLDQTLIYILNFKTLSLDKDSVADLECTVTSVNLKADVNGEKFAYQSGSLIDSTERLKFAEYESFVNNPFKIKVTKYGNVKEIYNTTNIVDKFLKMRGLTDSLTAQDKAMFNEDMKERSIRPIILQVLREVPEHEMAIDSTWSYKRESLPVMVFKIDYTNKYQVEKIEMLNDDRIAVIDGVVKTNITGEQTHTERGVTYNFDKPTTSATGKIYFNLDKGLIQKSRTQTRMENNYRMEIPTPQGTQKGSAREITSNTNVLELL